MAGAMNKFPFSQAYLRSRLRYNKKTGIFIWRTHPDLPSWWNDRFAGTEAGTPDDKGYIQIGIYGKLYRAHRLAWFYVYGEQPDEIDHKDLISSHNWLDNLRPATSKQNLANRGIPLNNTSGYKGVSKSRNKWRAYIYIDGVKKDLGSFDSPEDASAAYIKAAKKHRKQFARWGNTIETAA